MIVEFDVGTWADPFIQELSPQAKLLFIYFWTNSHKNVSCLYTITYKTIRDETGLNQKQIEDTLSILYPKVIYDPQEHIVFVPNHVKRTFLRTGNISPKIVQAIKKDLLAVKPGHFTVGIFLNKYGDLDIEYPYPIDTLPIGYQDTLQVKGSRLKVQGSELKEGDSKGKQKVTFLPKEFSLTDSMRTWAAENGYDRMDERLEHFRDWATAGAKKYADWEATFRNAVRCDWAHFNNGKNKHETQEEQDARWAAALGGKR